MTWLWLETVRGRWWYAKENGLKRSAGKVSTTNDWKRLEKQSRWRLIVQTVEIHKWISAGNSTSRRSTDYECWSTVLSCKSSILLIFTGNVKQIEFIVPNIDYAVLRTGGLPQKKLQLIKLASKRSRASSVLAVLHIVELLKAKFHYAIWFEPASNQIRTN